MHSFIFSKNNVKKSSSCYNGRRLTTAGHCAHITGHYFVVWVPSRPGSAQKTSGKGEPRFAPLSHSNILSFQIVNFAKNIVGNLCYYKKESGLNTPLIYLLPTEPSACELIEEFLSVDNKNSNSKPGSERVVDVDAPPTPPTLSTSAPVHYTKKQLALKILVLKVAASLHWNLGMYQSKILFGHPHYCMHNRKKYNMLFTVY